MRVKPNETSIVIPGVIGMSLRDPEVLNPTEYLEELYNMDTRIPGYWTKRLPIAQVSIASLAASPIYGLFYFLKKDGSYYDIVVLKNGNIYVQWYTSDVAQGWTLLAADYFTDAYIVRGVKYRNKLFLFNGIDSMKFFLDVTDPGGSGETFNYGVGGVFSPSYRPNTADTGYTSDSISYKAYVESDGGILGGTGGGIIQYREIFEFEDGVLYGNPGGGGYHAHEFSTFGGGNGYGQPVFEFQWMNRYQLESVSGVFDVESADNSLVTARTFASRYKHYADEPFSAWERHAARNIGDMTSSSESGFIDAQKRTGYPADLDNDEPPKFKHACVVGGDSGVMIYGRELAPRPIPYPVVKIDKWGTPTYRNKITIANNSSSAYTRPTVRIDVPASKLAYASSMRDIGAQYEDIVFTDDDGRTIWDCYVDPFNDGNTSFGNQFTAFNITVNGSTTTYTWTGALADPNFETNGLAVDDYLVINADNFSASNNGTFIVTSVSDGAVSVTNANGVGELNKTIGATGSIKRNNLAFIVTPLELPAGASIQGYIYYKSNPAGTETFYGAWNHVLHPPYVESDQLFNSWCRERYFPPLSTSGNDPTDGANGMVNKASNSSTRGGVWLYNDAVVSRPYGLDTDNNEGNIYPPAVTVERSRYRILVNDAGEDLVGRALENFSVELWAKVGVLHQYVLNWYHIIIGYRVGDTGGSDENFLIAHYRDDGTGDVGVAGDYLALFFAGESGVAKFVEITTGGGNDAGFIRNDPTSDAGYWTYIGVSVDSSGNYSAVVVPVVSSSAPTNWSDQTSSGIGTFTTPAYDLGDGSGAWVFRPGTVGLGDVTSIGEMYLGEVRLTERYMTRRELMDRARDFTWHGATSLTDSTSQPTLSVGIDDTQESLSAGDANYNAYGWSKFDGEVFPVLYEREANSPVNGVVEWQDDAFVFCENEIHRIVTTNQPEDWDVIENIGQEIGVYGLIAPGCFFKTPEAIIFMSMRGLTLFDGHSRFEPLSEELIEEWVKTYGIANLRLAKGYYHPALDMIFVDFYNASAKKKCFGFDYGAYVGRRNQALKGRKVWFTYGLGDDEEFGHIVSAARDGSAEDGDVWLSWYDETNPAIVKLEKRTTTNMYKDDVPGGSSTAVSWRVKTAEMTLDDLDVSQIEVKATQEKTDATERSPAKMTIKLVRDGTTETFSNRSLSSIEPFQPAAQLCEIAQVRLEPDTTNDPTDQTRIRSVQVAVRR